MYYPLLNFDNHLVTYLIDCFYSKTYWTRLSSKLKPTPTNEICHVFGISPGKKQTTNHINLSYLARNFNYEDSRAEITTYDGCLWVSYSLEQKKNKLQDILLIPTWRGVHRLRTGSSYCNSSLKDEIIKKTIPVDEVQAIFNSVMEMDETYTDKL